MKVTVKVGLVSVVAEGSPLECAEFVQSIGGAGPVSVTGEQQGLFGFGSDSLTFASNGLTWKPSEPEPMSAWTRPTHHVHVTREHTNASRWFFDTNFRFSCPNQISLTPRPLLPSWTVRAVRRFLDDLSPSAKELLDVLRDRYEEGGATKDDLRRLGVPKDPRALGPVLGAINRLAERLDSPPPVETRPHPDGEDRLALTNDFAAIFVHLFGGKNFAAARAEGGT